MRSISRAVTLYDRIRPGSLWMEIPVLTAFNLVLVLTAYLSISLPFSPVPITGQTFGVLLVALALGSVRGTGVILAYLLEGLAGLPVFAGGSAGPHVLVGPTGGYLLGFLVAAWLTGRLADRGWSHGYVKAMAAMILGTATIFLCGLAQLSLFVPRTAALTSGLWPFLPGAALKVAAVTALLPSVWKFFGCRDH